MSSNEALHLRSRWRDRQHFTILDADFGIGLRFLDIWADWQVHPQRPDRLHVIGLMNALPDAIALSKQFSLAASTARKECVDKLINAWPLNLPGLHRMDFEDGAVTLTLLVGDRGLSLERLRAKVDLFCLSSEDSTDDLSAQGKLFETLVRLAGPDADIVFPAGLDVDHRELTERLNKRSHSTTSNWEQFAQKSLDRCAIVVGAGFAGMGVAHALALRGWAVTVIDKKSASNPSTSGEMAFTTHARHVSAAQTPMVSRDDDLRARLSRAGSLRSMARWRHLPKTVVNRCGAIQLQRDQGRIVDLSSVLAALRFPTEWARYVDAQEASVLSGRKLARGGIYFPTAAQVNPQGLIDALACTPGIQLLEGDVDRLAKANDQWLAQDAGGNILAQAPYVVVASAMDSFNILNRSHVLPEDSRLSKMHALAGEITLLPNEALAGGPRCIVSGDGYVLPAVDGFCVAGSSYVHGATQAVSTAEGRIGNLKRAAGLLNQPHIPQDLCETALPGWAGWRAVMPGRLPVVGPVPETYGLWVACGFASRGLTWAPLAGDLIAAALNAEPLPLENDIIDAISAI